MKKILFISLFCFIWIPGKESPIIVNNDTNIIYSKEKTSFQLAFDRIHSFEGYYSNHHKDKGGETYRGIARRFNKNWYGWRKVDEFKQNNQIKWNQVIPEADFWVTDYYVSLWVKEGFDLINDKDLASYVFEFRIHGTHAIRIIKRQINKQIDIPINNIFTSESIIHLNKINKELFLKDLKKARVQYYYNIVKKDSTQKIFIKHWLTRINYD